MIPNSDREAIVYDHWKIGMTIDKISLITSIPRSTVGYYVKKMRRKYGRPLQAITSEPPVVKRSKEERFLEAKVKNEFDLKIWKLFQKGDYRTIVDLVEAFFAYNRFSNYCNQRLQGGEQISWNECLEFNEKFPFKIFEDDQKGIKSK